LNKKTKKKKLDIIYEDKEIIVINKPAKQLCIGTLKDREHTLYNEVSTYVKKQNPKNKIFIVHRLDKDTSGIVLFAKNENMKRKLQDNWDNLALNREYIAVVDGIMPKKKDTLKDYLKESKTLQVYVTDDKKNGKLAITDYEVIKKNRVYSMLKINIHTGRKNQIRVQLANINHPIVGDKKYKSRNNPFGRLALHASKLEIIHPISKKKMIFESKIPTIFEIFDNI
jgi:23S rRNA pseudouridine1911/1915/1917 synthase